MEMKKVLKVILIRSGVLLSLLVVLIVGIKTIIQHGPPVDSKRTKPLAVLMGEDIQEHALHIKGIKDGIVFNGLRYTPKLYNSPSEIIEPSLVYCLDPCLCEDIIKMKEGEPFNIICYSYLHRPQDNYTGIYCELEWRKIFSIYKSILPKMKNLGIIYSEGSCDGERQALALEKVLEIRPQISLRLQPLGQKNIDKSINDLFAHVDVIYAVARDLTIQANLETIFQICLDNNVPLIGGGVVGPEMGAVASVAHDPYRVGRKATEIIRAIEAGGVISEIEVARIEPELYLNLTSAYSLGVIIPSSIRKKARKIFD